MAREASAASDIHELALKADEAARGDAIFEPCASPAVGFHVHEVASAHAARLHPGALVRVFDVDRELLERLALHAIDLANDDARTRHRHFVALAPHVFE